MNITIKAPKLKILDPKIKNVYFAQKINDGQGTCFQQIEEGFLDRKMYLVLETKNIRKDIKLKINVFQYTEEKGEVLLKSAKNTDLEVFAGNYKNDGGTATQAITEITLGFNDNQENNYFILRREKRLHLTISIDVNGDSEVDKIVRFILKDSGFWYQKNRFVLEKRGLNLDEEGFSTNKNIIVDKIDNIKREKKMDNIKAIILHRTVSSNYQGKSMKIAKEKIPGTHFFVDKNGAVYQTVSLKNQTLHLYEKKGQMYDEYLGILTNANTIGIEVIGMYFYDSKEWEPLTKVQSDAVSQLVIQIKEEYNLTNSDIYAHEKIQRKTLGEGEIVWNAIKDKIF